MASELETPELVLHWHYDPAAAANPGVPNTGNLVANQPVTPAAAQIGGSLKSDEVWEINPEPEVSFDGKLAAGAAPEDFSLQWLIDGADQPTTGLYFRGAPDLNSNPGAYYIEGYGGDNPPVAHKGMYTALKMLAAGRPLHEVIDAAATLKVTENLTFVLTPLTAIDRVIDIKVYGKRWNKTVFNRVLKGQQISGKYAVRRQAENLSIAFNAQWPTIAWDTWNQQIGGASQGTLKGMPWQTTAINTVASQLNTDLLLSYASGASGQAQVESTAENLAFKYAPTDTNGNRVLALTRVGARSRWQYATGAGTHLRWAFIHADNDLVSKYHPSHLWMVTDTDNRIGMGIQQPFGPANGKYRRGASFVFPIFGDHIAFGIRDDGQATITAGQAAVQPKGTLISGYKGASILRNGQPVTN